MTSAVVLIAVASTSAMAQLLPPTYLQVEFLQSKQQIIALTDGSYGDLLKTYDGIGWTAQNLWTSVAQWDYQLGRQDYAERVRTAQDALFASPGGGNEVWKVPGVNYYNDDNGWAGLASVQAYEAYGDDIFLTRARDIFKFTEGHGLITEAALDDGWLKGVKNEDNKIQADCDGKSNLGGVYWVNGGNPAGDSLNAAAQSTINAVSTGTHALLGAELCRITNDTGYCDKALASAQWLDRHMIAHDGYLFDNLDLKTCAITDWKFTYNQGLYIAVYAQLGHLTGNATATKLARDAAQRALLPAAPWNSDTGIIKEGKGDVDKSDDGIGFKSIMIRYLQKVAPWLDDDELVGAITEYVNIQYYALAQLDSDSPTRPVRYGRNWEGPYSMSSDHAQLAAMDVLNAIHLNPDNAFPSDGQGKVIDLIRADQNDSRPAEAPTPSSALVRSQSQQSTSRASPSADSANTVSVVPSSSQNSGGLTITGAGIIQPTTGPKQSNCKRRTRRKS